MAVFSFLSFLATGEKATMARFCLSSFFRVFGLRFSREMHCCLMKLPFFCIWRKSSRLSLPDILLRGYAGGFLKLPDEMKDV